MINYDYSNRKQSETCRSLASRLIADCTVSELGENVSGSFGRQAGKYWSSRSCKQNRESTARQNMNLRISRLRNGSERTWAQTKSRLVDVQRFTSHSANAVEMMPSASSKQSISLSEETRPTNWQKACKGAAKNKVNWLPDCVTSAPKILNDGLRGERNKALFSPRSAPCRTLNAWLLSLSIIRNRGLRVKGIRSPG